MSLNSVGLVNQKKNASLPVRNDSFDYVSGSKRISTFDYFKFIPQFWLLNKKKESKLKNSE